MPELHTCTDAAPDSTDLPRLVATVSTFRTSAGWLYPLPPLRFGMIYPASFHPCQKNRGSVTPLLLNEQPIGLTRSAIALIAETAGVIAQASHPAFRGFYPVELHRQFRLPHPRYKRLSVSLNGVSPSLWSSCQKSPLSVVESSYQSLCDFWPH